ncbi:hypothetical protein IFM89_032568 [Coptis chinensis]|uniref:WRKY domain-containing protein n=1 Tax=Coptis chinensis TaxID=261450 RepID=A0A835I7F1_9MAGN|nr:hypothetical protein IFM89_032568 [Coptis chinensis]
MVHITDYEQKALINELTQGRDLLNQLMFHLNPSSLEGEQIIEKLISSSNKALSMLSWNGPEAEPAEKAGSSAAIVPHSVSPRSYGSDQRDICKKRRTMTSVTEKIRVWSGAGVEGPQEDGHSWRKYGQKPILGAKFPRSYYRCTYQKDQGCLATKQVQQSDDNPSMFEITYIEKHTCYQASLLVQASKAPHKQDQSQNQLYELEENAKQDEELMGNFCEGLEVNTGNKDMRKREGQNQNYELEQKSKQDEELLRNICEGVEGNQDMRKRESNVLSHHMTNNGDGLNFQTSESDLTEIISALILASTSPAVVESEFSLDSFDYDSSFTFDTLGFLT